MAVALSLLPALVVSTAAAGEVELAVPLQDGRSYLLRDLYRECNAKLGSNVDLQAVPDRRVEITLLERAALLLLNETGVIRVSFGNDALTLILPDSQDDAVRRENRKRLERLLGISLTEWPEGMGLHLPADFDPQQKTIVLVHGLESGLAELDPLRIACRNSSLQPILFNYPNDGPLAWSGDRLSRDLKALAAKHPQLRVAIVAHSMGGLVVRQALEAPDNNPGCVTDVFFLGTPHRGSELATVGQPWLEMIYQPLPTKDRLIDGLGEASADLAPGSRFLSRLNGFEPPTEVRYYSAIGTRSFLTDEELNAIKQQFQAAASDRRRPTEQQLRVLQLLALPELRDGQGDGAVSAASARHPAAQDEKRFECNHLELLHLAGQQPERHEVFRWILSTLDTLDPKRQSEAP